jgi:lipopolysaccharide transport system permease protein
VSGTVTQLRRLGQYGDLLTTLSRHRLSVRCEQSKLGAAWAILQPLAMMVVFTAVFAKLVRVPRQGIPYGLFAHLDILPWTFFSNAVSTSTNSPVHHAQLVTAGFFPDGFRRRVLGIPIAMQALMLCTWKSLPRAVSVESGAA